MKNRVNEKAEPELMKLLQEKREELRAFHFNVTGAKVKNVKLARNTKKQIARVLTQLTGIKNK
jgi:ribosomal protein L29